MARSKDGGLLDSYGSSTEHGGLEVVEWIRGYSILRLYANRDEVDPRLDIYELDLAEFQAVLEKGGLNCAKARLFVESIIFQIGKRDLYDAPVIVDADGRYWLLAPLFANANVSEIVLSQLGSRGVGFETKGSAFERSIKELFRSAGIPAKGFKYSHDGREYECDLAVLWDEHLFVIECKNDFLPTSRPVLSYFFPIHLGTVLPPVTFLR